MNIQTIEELHKQTTDAFFPVLIDIMHDDIFWDSESFSTGLYENGHLRLINDPRGVEFEGKTYLPSGFSFSEPSDDGKGVGQASIVINAVDERILQLIENISSKPVAQIQTGFERINENELFFVPLQRYSFQLLSVDLEKPNAKWKLSQEPLYSLNAPRDLATSLRCPSAN